MDFGHHMTFMHSSFKRWNFKEEMGIIAIYLLHIIGISRENRKFPENFLFSFDFTINSKYVILFHFETNQQLYLPGEEKLLYLPLTRQNRKFSGLTRDVFGFKWNKNNKEYRV